MSPMIKLLMALLINTGIGVATCQAQTAIGNIDVSQCDNCDAFPSEWLLVEDKQLIDHSALPPARRLDFLIGEWELFFPKGAPGDEDYSPQDKPIAHERFTWFGDKAAIHGDQYWGDKEAPGFQARSDFRYVAKQERWQWTWLTTSTAAMMNGGYAADGTMAFREFNFDGDRHDLTLAPSNNHIQYVFRNVTGDQFIQEEWRQSEAGVGPYNKLMWQVLYQRVENE